MQFCLTTTRLLSLNWILQNFCKIYTANFNQTFLNQFFIYKMKLRSKHPTPN